MIEPTHVLKDLDGERLVAMGSEDEQDLLWEEEAFVRDEIGTKIICLKRQLRPIEEAEHITDFTPPSDQVLSPAATAARIEAVNPQGLSPVDLSRIQINTASLVAATVVGAVSAQYRTEGPTTYAPASSEVRTLDDFVQGKPNRSGLAGGEFGKLRPKTLAALEVAYALTDRDREILIRTRDAMTQAQCRALIRHGYICVEGTRVGRGIEWISITPAGAARVERIREERE